MSCSITATSAVIGSTAVLSRTRSSMQPYKKLAVGNDPPRTKYLGANHEYEANIIWHVALAGQTHGNHLVLCLTSWVCVGASNNKPSTTESYLGTLYFREICLFTPTEALLSATYGLHASLHKLALIIFQWQALCCKAACQLGCYVSCERHRAGC